MATKNYFEIRDKYFFILLETLLESGWMFVGMGPGGTWIFLTRPTVCPFSFWSPTAAIEKEFGYRAKSHTAIDVATWGKEPYDPALRARLLNLRLKEQVLACS